MSFSILLVEDDHIISEIISTKLQEKGYIVFNAYKGDAVEKMVIRHVPDCIILDLGLPNVSGYDVLTKLKAFFKGAIIVFTSQSSEKAELKGLKLGADDFVHKSKSFDVLFERVNRLLKNKSLDAEDDRNIHDLIIGDFSFNKRYLRCSYLEKDIPLTNDEFELLYFLLLNENRVITRDELFIIIKGIPYDGVSRGIDVAVSRLKEKLCRVGIDKRVISSLRGKGYVFKASFLNENEDVDISGNQ